MNPTLNSQLGTCLLLLSLLTQLTIAQDFRRRDPERIHDPSTVYTENKEYYFFSTGHGVSLIKEQDDGRWTRTARVFEQENLPAWHKEKVPANRGHLWAPDVIKLKDTYYLYYSVSSFGKQTSAIGIAAGKTLDPKSPDWGWKDQGPVITSDKSKPFNAIDPALFKDDDGSLWMSWGSFWNGLYLAQLDPKTGKLLDPKNKPTKLAWSAKIEAPFIHKRDGYYYLFVNHGLCCQGVNSTYDIRVGRSKKITGPYLDQDKVDLKDGGGTLLLETDGDRIGPGHASILKRNGREFLAYHYYSKPHRGSSRFALAPLTWEKGWPVIDDLAENPPSKKTNQAPE
ncbi:arabinan endo-1,5-alpha-L-arabinosidase [Akkermansiaceae bacterium]|nr:arabinan endo-1,5-alpha-L-arabinosidase [Akkermansiaceae bacterium]